MLTPYITVKEINERIKGVIQSNSSLNNIVVKGEIASLTNQGHIYMTLKDLDDYKIQVVLYKWDQGSVYYIPSVGDEVLIYGSINVFAQRGTYQLTAKDITRFGEGQKLIELERLRKSLQQEGLFDESHKQSIPNFPTKISIITAKTGAAIHDIVKNIVRRYPLVELNLCSSAVQGENAPRELKEALKKAMSLKPSIIIIGRGGGDKEDLSAFNDEELVRMIYDCQIPVISAVGHESDVTLVDYVADLRASTPTDAAVKATPNLEDIIMRLIDYRDKLNYNTKNLLTRYSNEINQYKENAFFKNPYSYIENMNEKLKYYHSLLDTNFIKIINYKNAEISNLKLQIDNGIKFNLNTNSMKIDNLKNSLDIINPKHLISRGYSLTFDEDGNLIKTIEEVKNGQTIKTMLSNGEIVSKVFGKE